MLPRSGGGSKPRLLQTASQFHDRMVAVVEEQKCTTQLDGRRSSSYCKNIYLPTLFPQVSLITMRRRLKQIDTHVIVTYKMQVIPFLLPRRSKVTSTMNKPANQMGATQIPNETRRVASVVQVINTNRILYFRFLFVLLLPCSACRHMMVHRLCGSYLSKPPCISITTVAIGVWPAIALPFFSIYHCLSAWLRPG